VSCATVNPTLLEVNLGDLGVEVNLVARQGADADRIVIRLIDTAGNVLNVAGATVTAEIRKSLDEVTAAGAFTVTVDDTEIRLDLTADTLADLDPGAHARDPAGLHVWDCKAVFADTTKRWLAWGELRVLKPVTRP